MKSRRPNVPGLWTVASHGDLHREDPGFGRCSGQESISHVPQNYYPILHLPRMPKTYFDHSWMLPGSSLLKYTLLMRKDFQPHPQRTEPFFFFFKGAENTPLQQRLFSLTLWPFWVLIILLRVCWYSDYPQKFKVLAAFHAAGFNSQILGQ